MAKDIDSKMQECIRECDRSYEQAVLTMTHCLTLGGKHAEADHIKLLLDCAEITKLSEGFMLRNSDFYADLCELCAEICEECAESCETVDPEDKQMQKCAEACRKCAEVCREM